MNYTGEEISDMLGITNSAIYENKERALKKLKENNYLKKKFYS